MLSPKRVPERIKQKEMDQDNNHEKIKYILQKG
jgi:hypothetical protein